jgi:hypothetical protein
LIDPRRQRAFTYRDRTLEEIDGFFTADEPAITLSLEDVFRGL